MPKPKEELKMPTERETTETLQLSSHDETSGPDTSPRTAKAKSPTQIACGRIDAAYEALKSNQPGAEEDLYKAFKTVAEIIAWSCFGLKDEDLFQDIISAAFLGLPRFHGKSRLSTWFITLVKNRCKEALRQIYIERERNTISLSMFEEMGGQEPEESATEPYHEDPSDCDAYNLIDAAIDLEIAMEELPEEQLHVIEMYMEGHSDAEIADQDGTPLGTVKGRRRLGLDHMREKISRGQ